MKPPIRHKRVNWIVIKIDFQNEQLKNSESNQYEQEFLLEVVQVYWLGFGSYEFEIFL